MNTPIRKAFRNFKKISLFLILIFGFYCIQANESANKILNFTANVRVEKDKLIEENTYEILVSCKQENWISEIEIPFQNNQKIEIIEASIRSLDNKVLRKLKKKEIVTRNYRSQDTFHDDYYVKEFQLNWHQYPYIIKYQYKKTFDEFLSIANWFPLVYKNVPTLNASLTIDLPIDKAFKTSISGEYKERVNKVDERMMYNWEIENIPAINNEYFSPPSKELTPYIKVIPMHFTYGHDGCFDSWQSYGEWLSLINHGLDILTDNEKAKVDRLIHGLENEIEIINTLFKYLQENTRYVNISLDIGGLKPYPASYVCEKKYGDCKALTIYMKALLKYAGINSYYTIVNAGINPEKIKTDFPSHQFNHVILCVPLNNDTLWLENTSKLKPYNYLGTFSQGRKGLLVNESESKLVNIPKFSLQDVLNKNIYELKLNEDGNCNVKTSHEFKGWRFEKHLRNHSLSKKEDQKDLIRKNLSLKNFEIQSWNYYKANSDTPTISLSCEVLAKDQIKRIGNAILIKQSSNLIKLTPPEKREYPIKVSIPINNQDSYLYHFPFDKYTARLPENKTIKTKYGEFSEYYKLHKDTLRVSKQFKLFAGQYPKSEYEDFYSFFEQIKEVNNKNTIILKPH